jgi:hypothetical protein
MAESEQRDRMIALLAEILSELQRIRRALEGTSSPYFDR